jgi:hypothetical protein
MRVIFHPEAHAEMIEQARYSLIRPVPRATFCVMDTLAEIEAAVEALPPDEKEELLRFIAARLREETVSSSLQHQFGRSKRGFPVSKGRVPFTSADVARIESNSEEA